MASSLKCATSSINTHAAAIGVQVELRGDSQGRAAAALLAAELTSSFRATAPKLHIQGLCHGALRVTTQQGLEPRAWQPQLLPPDPACHGDTQSGQTDPLPSAACLPLWNVTLFRGRCEVQQDIISSVAVPCVPLHRAADAFIAAQAVDYTKSACSSSFPGFPASWQDTYCAQFEAHYCVEDTPQVVRFILTAHGVASVPAQLAIDNELIAFVSESGPPETVHGIGLTKTDAVVVLSPGCHQVSVVYDDAPALQEGNCTMVCSHRHVPPHNLYQQRGHAPLYGLPR
jgi:hypothetical protein